MGVDPRCHVVVGVVDETWRPGPWADGESGRDLALSVDCAVPAEMGRRARPAEREAPSLIVIQALSVHGYSDMRLLYQPRSPGPGVWDSIPWETIVPGISGNSEIFWPATNHREWVSR